MEDKRTAIIIAVVIFVFGLLIGYGMWGGKESKIADINQLLSQITQQIESIQKENQDLKLKLKNEDTTKQKYIKLKEELDISRKDNTQIKDELSKVTAQLTNAESKLKAEEETREVTDSLRSRISQLEQENRNLKQIMEEIGTLTTKQEPAESKQTDEKTPLEEHQEKDKEVITEKDAPKAE